MPAPSIDIDPFDGYYELGELLGSGGMGNVYSAMQVSLGRRVAIKVPQVHLLTNPRVMRRFRAEALAGSRIDHRNIARVMDFGDRHGVIFLVMQYLSGVTLDRLLLERGAMESKLGADLCGQVLDGLAAAHNAGVIHADIKSANVIVSKGAGGVSVAHIIDFGLARFANEPSSDDDRMLSGTPEYLAPELIRGGLPTAASDIYAAGIVLYELLTGTTPFVGGTSDDILRRHTDDPVVPPSLRSPDVGINAAVDAVIARALAKNPAARFETAASFAAALRACPPAVVTKIARGTLAPPFSMEATTRDIQRELPAPRSSENARLQVVRVSVADSIERGDGDDIVTSYLELARALIDRRDLPKAITELERGLRILRPNADATPPEGTWRLQLCLAALYSGVGQMERARDAATVGRQDALRAGSKLGQARADELLTRLTRSGPTPRPRQ